MACCQYYLDIRNCSRNAGKKQYYCLAEHHTITSFLPALLAQLIPSSYYSKPINLVTTNLYYKS